MPRYPDLTGKRFGRLVVMARDPDPKDSKTWWICECDCGETVSVRTALLISGKTRSCGCLHREELRGRLATHGMTGEPTYESWKHAKALDDVQMCQEWRESFEAFLADMGERPEGTKLARIDPERGFAPGNCAWLDQRTLNARRFNTRLFAWKGEERSIPEIARLEGLPAVSLRRQVAKDGDVAAAVKRTRERARR